MSNNLVKGYMAELFLLLTNLLMILVKMAKNGVLTE
jgi:hypothetical protein